MSINVPVADAPKTTSEKAAEKARQLGIENNQPNQANTEVGGGTTFIEEMEDAAQSVAGTIVDRMASRVVQIISNQIIDGTLLGKIAGTTNAFTAFNEGLNNQFQLRSGPTHFLPAETVTVKNG